MRINCVSLFFILLFSSTVAADDLRDANRLLRASNVASKFDATALRQTRNIIRSYSSIVAMSAEVELPQWIKLEIAACYQQAFAWENFKDGIAQILIENFSAGEMQLLTDFYQSEGLPPTQIANFKAAIAKGNLIQKLSTDYIFDHSEGCAEHDAELILSFLSNREKLSEKILGAE
jgi:hypothetical protein